MTKHETTINLELYKVKAKSYYHDKWLNGFFSNFVLGGLEIIDEKAMHCKIDENTLCRNTGKKIPDMHGKTIAITKRILNTSLSDTTKIFADSLPLGNAAIK